jgi:hypothetical protein
MLQVSLEYSLDGPCHLRKVMGFLLGRRPLGWFLIEPSSLSVA